MSTGINFLFQNAIEQVKNQTPTQSDSSPEVCEVDISLKDAKCGNCLPCQTLFDGHYAASTVFI